MSEENDNKQEPNEVQPDEPVQASPQEEKAMQMGWRPQDEWEGDPDDWVDAKEFIGRQKLYDRIQQNNKELKQVKLALDDFKKHHEKVREIEYERALQTLRQEKKRILEEGDADALLEIDDKIDEAKEKLKEAKQTPNKVPEINPEAQRALEDWMGKNQWYRQDAGLKDEADYIGYKFVQDQHAQSGVVPSPQEVLQRITQEMRRRHPEKFVNPRKNEPNKVDTEGTPTAKKSGSNSDVALSDEESQAMRRFVRMGVMTEKQYKDEIKKMRERV